MSENRQRRRNILIFILILVIIAILLLLMRCSRPKPLAPEKGSAATPPTPAAPSTPAPSAPEPEERLTAATLKAPAQVPAGSAFKVEWTGPDNAGDFLTILHAGSPANAAGTYRETKFGPTLEMTAPMEPGAFEVQYVTGRSKTILARAKVEVTPVVATLDATEEVVLGSPFIVAWTGPNNKGDFVTIVAKGTRDAEYANHAMTEKGSPLTLTAPPAAGEYELRYHSGQGNKILARRAIRITQPDVGISAPERAIAGTTIEVSWNGPNNAGDYITIVPKATPDGRYGNHEYTSKGATLKIIVPVEAGAAELRYMTGQGGRVLARRAIDIVAAEVSLDAPAEAIAGSTIKVTWTGPDNSGDYITIVEKSTPDGQYGKYTDTSKGSPLDLLTPVLSGEAEIRYMTGQGGHVLARRAINLVAPKVTLSAPKEGKAASEVSVEWTGPNNDGDYITIVPKGASDGSYESYLETSKGSPMSLKLPKTPGDAEIRYVTGQDRKVLARIPIKVNP